jgi:hypothetical protein
MPSESARAAPDINDVIRAFDAICVSSQLDEKYITKTVDLFAKQTGSKLARVDDEILKMASPGNKIGWAIANTITPFIVSYGERRDGAFLSRSCGISVGDIPQDIVISTIEKRYKVTKIIDEVQGVSKILVYTVNLFGYGDQRVVISIQASDIEKMSIISLFEIPK